MTNAELKQFYNDNQDFREYVDRSCRTGRWTVEQALTHKITNAVAEEYRNKPRKVIIKESE